MYTSSQLTLIAKQLAFCKIDRWHKAGYRGISHTTGKRIGVWNMEDENSDHGDGTEDSGYIFGPDCIIHTASLNGSITLGYYVQYKGVKYTPEEFIKEFNIKVMTRSIGGKASSADDAESRYWNRLGDLYKLIAFNSIGNDGTNGADASLPARFAFYICAGGLTDSGKFVVKYYSSRDPEADFITFTNFREGTSFASPSMAGTTTVIVGRYDDDMSKEELEAYLAIISKDIGVTGVDDESGHGLPIMPEVSKKYITMSVGNPKYLVDGEEKTMDTSPVNVAGNIFVPIRFVAEALGATVSWDEATDTATIVDNNGTTTIRDDTTIKITLGSTTALVEDDDEDTIFEKMQLNVAPFRDAAGRTMAPLRFVSETLGCHVAWVQKYQKVLILEK